jgi:hypothetical protein
MIEFLFFVAAGIVALYLLYQKIENEKKEDFEDRDN